MTKLTAYLALAEYKCCSIPCNITLEVKSVTVWRSDVNWA